MRKHLLFILAAAISLNSFADTLDVNYFKYAGPYPVQKPFMVDTTDVNGKAFKAESILDAAMPMGALKTAALVRGIPAAEGENLHLVGFSLQNQSFVKAKVSIKGVKHYQLYLDGDKFKGGEMKLEPATHDIVLKIYSDKSLDSLKIKVETATKGLLTQREDGGHIFSLDVNSHGESIAQASISYGGKYVFIQHSSVEKGDSKSSWSEVKGVSDGKVYFRPSGRINWMPSSDEYWYTRKTAEGRDLVCANPADGKERVLARNIPEGSFTIPPKGDYLIYSLSSEGPKEGAVHQILTPDDRQPGWRNRSSIARYDIATGIMQPLTFGYNNAWLSDISDNGEYILFTTSRQRLTERPTTLNSVYLMNVRTMETECLISDDGFISEVQFSPDGKEILVKGTAEAFGGFAKEVKEGQTPNYYQYQLFVLNIEDKGVRTLTAGITPSPQEVSWSRYDGRIYFNAEDRDCVNLFRIDPKTNKLEKLPNLEDNVKGYSLAVNGPTLVYRGQSLANGDRAYSLDILKLKQQKIEDASASRLQNVEMGQGLGFDFTSSRGDLINGFYVLPPNFDPQKKYPMLVHYYGGCSPTTRYAIGSYSPQYYAAQGYVFYVINPSGASGFGQEFAARHVNTAGDVVADDIIEGVQQFCKEHPFVDEKHIGCFSASYGGFMTQLLLIKTDMFATGISHAGISSHTSYWGEGYWGYSYSEVSMANSYPWTRKDLYVDRSPLYNADKIHTPLLFLHGSADTNVPIGESIQMFTALKLLGQDTAFVVVDGENHGISEYKKKRDWLRTISAWFAKYLKEDSSWWDEMYPPKTL